MPLPISKDYLLVQLRNFKSVILDPAYIIQKSTLPNAEEDNEGVIYQYTGTAAGMTLGGFYQCQEVTPATSPKTYHWVEITTKTSIDGVTIQENLSNEIYVPNATALVLGVIKLGDGLETDSNGATNVTDRIKVVSTMPNADATTVGEVVIYLGTTTASYKKGCIYQGISDEDPTSPTYSWNKLSGDTTQIATLPTASATELGNVYQYIGADDNINGYKHNYFYECVSDGESTPTYSWEQKDVQPSGSGIEYVDSLPTGSNIKNQLYGVKYETYTEETFSSNDDYIAGSAILARFFTAPTSPPSGFTPGYYFAIASTAEDRLYISDSGDLVPVYAINAVGSSGYTLLDDSNVVIKSCSYGSDPETFYYDSPSKPLYAGDAENETTFKVNDGIKIWGPGSREDWDRLSVAEKVQYDEAHFDDDEGAIPSDVYSTTETKTNKVWIDGKPIYRRVLKADSQVTITASWKSVSGITDVFNSIKSNMEIISEAHFFAEGATSLNRFEFRDTDGQVQIMVSSASSITCQQLALVLEYTKTTD